MSLGGGGPDLEVSVSWPLAWPVGCTGWRGEDGVKGQSVDVPPPSWPRAASLEAAESEISAPASRQAF